MWRKSAGQTRGRSPEAQHAVFERDAVGPAHTARVEVLRDQPLAGDGDTDNGDRVGEQLVVITGSLQEEVTPSNHSNVTVPATTASTRGWVASVAQFPISLSKDPRPRSRSRICPRPSHVAQFIAAHQRTRNRVGFPYREQWAGGSRDGCFHAQPQLSATQALRWSPLLSTGSSSAARSSFRSWTGIVLRADPAFLCAEPRAARPPDRVAAAGPR